MTLRKIEEHCIDFLCGFSPSMTGQHQLAPYLERGNQEGMAARGQNKVVCREQKHGMCLELWSLLLCLCEE